MIKLVYDFLIGCEKSITQHPGWITRWRLWIITRPAYINSYVPFFPFYHDPNSRQHTSKCSEPDSVNLSTPQSSSKDFIVLGGLDESSGQSKRGNKMGSIVGRMKANPRKATYIPLLKSLYYVPKNKREKVSRPNSKYCLSHTERSCLEGFWIRLYSK